MSGLVGVADRLSVRRRAAVICVSEVSRFHDIVDVLGITLLVAVGGWGTAFRRGVSRRLSAAAVELVDRANLASGSPFGPSGGKSRHLPPPRGACATTSQCYYIPVVSNAE